MPSTEEGGVCFAAEFTMERYLDPILELWVDVINKDGTGFVVREDRPGVGRIYKEWIPKLRISHAVKHRDGYPESTWFENAGSAEREAVMRTLDNIVQIYGYLHCLWYWHSPEELIGTMPTEGLINMFESFDDRAFDDILCDIAEFMSNSKVKDVLMHFAGHNDKVVAGLARQLLSV